MQLVLNFAVQEIDSYNKQNYGNNNMNFCPYYNPL